MCINHEHKDKTEIRIDKQSFRILIITEHYYVEDYRQW